jgi:HicB-like protein involved in pilus formation
MNIEPHLEALQTELASIAGVGDEKVVAVAQQLSQALGPAVALRLLNVLSEAALEISSQLPSGHVEIRLEGRNPSLLFVAREDPTSPPGPDEGLTARITLRLPDPLKASLETAAAQAGVSVNTWILKTLARGLSDGATVRFGNRLMGFGKS